MKIQLRYNTAAGDSNLKWRIVIDGKEHLASQVFFNIPCRTTEDTIEGVGIKHHVSCEIESNEITWNHTEVHIGETK